MKKFLASILAVLYLSTSMRATVHLHYCMDKLVGWTLLDHKNENCASCGMPKLQSGSGENCMVKMKNCCHEEQKHFKSEKDQKASQFFIEFAKISPAIADISLIDQGPCLKSGLIDHPPIKGPPLLAVPPIFLLNCNFRI